MRVFDLGPGIFGQITSLTSMAGRKIESRVRDFRTLFTRLDIPLSFPDIFRCPVRRMVFE
jgi:hypothetical protein